MVTYIALALFILLGFLLPKYVGRAKMKDRAKKYHESETATWGFCSREREGPWLTCIEGPVVVDAKFRTNHTFYSEWLVIRNGYVIVNPGTCSVDAENKAVCYDFRYPRTYSWDGCTPKVWFYWFLLIGTPDWQRSERKVLRIRYDQQKQHGVQRLETPIWQLAHRASLVHDALYQYLDSIPVSKEEVDELFKRMLIEDGMYAWLASLYHLFVKHFGARDVSTKAAFEDSHFTCASFDNVFKK